LASCFGLYDQPTTKKARPQNCAIRSDKRPNTLEKPHDEFTKRRIDRGGQGSGDYVFKGPSASEIVGYSDALKLMAFIDDIILLISSMF
jgi:hypothetical protein